MYTQFIFKLRTTTLAVLLILMAMLSCKKDNYTEPKTELSGSIVYQGNPIELEYDQVRMQLWQPGFGKLAAIDAPISQDGRYSALLFKGNYKLVFPQNQGPFITLQKNAEVKDTIYVNLSEDTVMDIEVLPYYMIRKAVVTKIENNIAAQVSLDKIIQDEQAKDIESVTLFLGRTQLVSRANNIAKTEKLGSELKDLTSIMLSVELPSLQQTDIYARVGVKIKNVEDMIFSKVEKVKL
ncbi:DUF3823 domain-containing protein [Dyadobacter tibetensis]|uniref:DUF3823 domain-containing protein n=1 Tax=Dyadobacter tibetensis TaxID=1211851 RepID=UPI00047028E2|nr:DUF3823 domain-containing protein [Dyadobacter tibetensis]